MTETPEKEPFLPFPKPDMESYGKKWHFLGTQVPQAQIVYFCQMIIVYVIIITAILNLSVQN